MCLNRIVLDLQQLQLLTFFITLLKYSQGAKEFVFPHLQYIFIHMCNTYKTIHYL